MIAPMTAFMKRLFFLIGIALAGAAFLAAGAEIAAHVLDPKLGLLPSAAEVWRVISPETYEAALIRSPETLGAAPWRSVLGVVLRLPGWLVLGAPGLALIIVCRERDDGPMMEHEHSLFLFDELAKRAREDGFSGGDIQTSDHADFEPADKRYARDDVADDVLGDLADDVVDEARDDHDFLLNGKNEAARRGGKTQNDGT